MPRDEMSALEAVEFAANQQAEGSSSESTEEHEEQPLSQPVDGTPPIEEGSEGSPQGPIPYDRHKAVLEKARAERAELEEQFNTYKQQLSWAENFDTSAWQRQQEILQQLNQDPIGFIQRLQREVEAHPHLGPQLRGAQPRELPKPSLRSEDGKSAYTAEEAQALIDHHVNQVQTALAQQLHGFQQEIQQLRAESVGRQRQEQAAQFSKSVTDEILSMDGAKEHEADIQAAFAKIPQRELLTDGVKACAYKAYLQVYRDKILPKRQKSSESKVVDTLKKKAAAGTLDPSGTNQSAGTTRPRTRKELQKFLEEAAKG